MPQQPPEQTNQIKQKKGAKRLLWGVAIILVLIAAGWSGFWYYGYTTTQALVDQFVAREVNGQKIVRCQDRKLGGYPVRLALDCSSYAVVDPASGWQVSGGPLQVYWQIHEPGQASIKTHAPMHIEQPAFGQSYDITGSLIQSSVLLTPPNGIRAVSFKAEEATLSANNAVLGQPVGTIKADSLEFNASPRQQTTGDLDLTFKASELSINRIPVLNGEMTFTAKDGLNALMQDRRDPAGLWLRQSGKIENIDGWLEIGQKTLKLKGDIAFNQAGLANGTLKLRILNPNLETAKVKATLSAKRDGFNGPLTGLQLMGKPVRDGDLVGSEVKITLVNGAIKAGFLPLGTLPALR
ncbi:DUF2125 domain-containing protein [Cohaesibacter marisflavi]|uniref:DUF2125 domain-containing protein n=1 Tax=Cohaesibacter marisflavi TaxID=655353 RepID=UPI0029C78326|nr:DUF2125 domain-containing protein [Cohaesibacter marisflavi]